MNNSLKLSLALLPLCASLHAQTLQYAKNSLHAFLPPSERFSILVGVEGINDTIDVLNIKEEQFTGTSIGDMTGANLELSYTLGDFYLHAQYNTKYFDYNGPTLVNDKFDVYLRYNLLNSTHFALSIDGGFETNIAKDTIIDDLNTINKTLSRAYPDNEITVTEDTITVDGVEYGGLASSPTITIEDTYDRALYVRVLSTYKSDSSVYDIYGGVKQIQVVNTITTSLSDEPSLPNADFHSKREDTLLFVGLSYSYELSDFMIESSYEYNSILRIDSLQVDTQNHIVNVDLLYSINKDFILYLGGKLFTNQLNGEIPYLYQTYSQTSFDHLYGFAEMGLLVKF